MRRKTKGVFSLPGGQKAQMKREGLKQRIIDIVLKIFVFGKIKLNSKEMMTFSLDCTLLTKMQETHMILLPQHKHLQINLRVMEIGCGIHTQYFGMMKSLT